MRSLVTILVAIAGKAIALNNLSQEQGENAGRQPIFTVEIGRHCEREDSKTFNFAADPDQEFKDFNSCTSLGINHNYSNGQHLRNFFGDFISDSYSADQVYTQTTSEERTLDSARAQLEGLYGTKIQWPNVDESITLNTIENNAEDMICHLGDNCMRFTQIIDAVKADPNTKQMLSEIDADFEATLFPTLRQLTNMPDASTQDMHDVCTYIYWLTINEIKMTFELTDEQFNQCQVSYQRNTFQEFDAHEELTYLPAFEMAQNLADLAKVSRGEMQLSEASTFMNYFNMSGRKLETVPRFFYYSAHAETLGPLLRFYHQESEVPMKPVPASMIIFDYYSEAGKFWIEGKYVAGDNVMHFLNIESEYFEHLSTSVLNGYATMMGTADMLKVCQKAFEQPANVSLSSARAFKKVLYETYDFDPSPSENLAIDQF